MGAQIILCDGFEVVPPPEMNDLILFGSEQSGSNCDASTVTTEEDGTVFSGDSSPGGGVAEEEWPVAKPFSFYFVKQPAYDDPDIRTQIDDADQEIYCCNKRRIEISNVQKSERIEMSTIIVQMEDMISESEGYKVVIEEKMKEIDTLQEGLRSLRCSESDQLCFTSEELDHLISMAHYVIEHGSTGVEEKDWLPKGTEKPDGIIILSEDSLAKKEESITSLKSMVVELSEVKQELEAITSNIDYLNTKIAMIQNKLRGLDIELAFVLETRDRSYEKIKRLRIQRDKGNAAFFQSLAVMRKAKELAASGNVRDLEVFASSEVDRFMTHWNDDKAFRDDYVKRVSLSLYDRQLSRDGRISAPESEAQVVGEKQARVKAGEDDVAVKKSNREDSSSNSSQDGNVVTDKRKKEARKKAKEFNRSSAEESDVTDLEFPVYEIPKKEEEEVDEETLKERKREEQLEKARLAMERKRKLQEKAAAKAAIRAQKEAEKKLKECEKKAKKKAAANASSPSESDQSREVINEQEKVKTTAVSAKEKHQKERSLFPKQRSFRYKHRGRGTEALPKAILNRRRAHRYWVWGISSAVLALVLVLVFLLLR